MIILSPSVACRGEVGRPQFEEYLHYFLKINRHSSYEILIADFLFKVHQLACKELAMSSLGAVSTYSLQYLTPLTTSYSQGGTSQPSTNSQSSMFNNSCQWPGSWHQQRPGDGGRHQSHFLGTQWQKYSLRSSRVLLKASLPNNRSTRWVSITQPSIPTKTSPTSNLLVSAF